MLEISVEKDADEVDWSTVEATTVLLVKFPVVEVDDTDVRPEVVTCDAGEVVEFISPGRFAHRSARTLHNNNTNDHKVPELP